MSPTPLELLDTAIVRGMMPRSAVEGIGDSPIFEAADCWKELDDCFSTA
ncbi:MAG: hypothetical protein ACRC46_10645 [Thermoguttaceae bacterium]